jgi:hypothetical protein
LSKLSKLFPEYGIKTDYDVIKLIQEVGDEVLTELQKRMKEVKHERREL